MPAAAWIIQLIAIDQAMIIGINNHPILYDRACCNYPSLDAAVYFVYTVRR